MRTANGTCPVLIIGAMLVWISSCNQIDPDELDIQAPDWTWTCGSETTDEPTDGMSYFPVTNNIEVSFWHYGGLEGDNGDWIANEDSWENITTIEDETGYSNSHGHSGPFYMVEDTPTQNLNKVTRSWLIEEDGVVLRVHKEEFIDGSPTEPWLVVDYFENGTVPMYQGEPIAVDEYQNGFKRFDDNWLSQEPGWSEVVAYIRQETGGTAETRVHRFTVVDVDLTLDLPVGTFTGCIQMNRERLEDEYFDIDLADPNPTRGYIKNYWFCPGIGKVKEQEVVDDENPRTEDILYFCIPGGMCCPQA
jgi:hypothetical protein